MFIELFYPKNFGSIVYYLYLNSEDETKYIAQNTIILVLTTGMQTNLNILILRIQLQSLFIHSQNPNLV